MSTWDQSEIAVTQSLARIEATLQRLEGQVSALQQYTSEQKGKSSVTALWVSTVVAGVISTIIKLVWHK